MTALDNQGNLCLIAKCHYKGRYIKKQEGVGQFEKIALSIITNLIKALGVICFWRQKQISNPG